MSITILKPRQTKKILGVLFDMDGVVLDSEKLYSRFWSEACAFYGFPMTYEQSLGMRSLNADAGQAYLSSLFGPTIVHKQVRDKRIELMDLYVNEHGIEPKPGIEELLIYLNDHGIPCALTTASPLERARTYLDRLDLTRRFTKLCSAKQVPHGKPEPDIYLYGAASLELPPENCLAIEDSFAGICSASAAGCMATIIPDLDQPGPRILEKAYAKIDCLLDVIPMLNL